ncbi:MAG: hypothetical protein EAZ30_17900 [Betaproteobacteria bacterium]|nr:MAG: hypothetical protein EAZ30_17900 [Betaproteobacteria bacterium]
MNNIIANNATPVVSVPARQPLAVSAPLRCTCLALSGSLDAQALADSAARLRQRGHTVGVPTAANAQWRYFAGTDEARLAALTEAIESDADVILFARGGYGLSRILHRIDWSAVADSGKIFCGYSDVTAFSLAALAQANYVTYAGPVLSGMLAEGDDAEANEFAYAHWLAALSDPHHDYGGFANDISQPAQSIEGTLWGTNLALVSHLVGTPYLPRIDDGILVLEDIAESPYRVERMLWQLKLAGILDRQRAIVLGQFTDCQPGPALRYPYAMSEVLETLRGMVRCPVLTGFPFGHIARKVTLPMGAHAELRIDGEHYHLRLLGA